MQWLPFKLLSKIMAVVSLFIFPAISFFDDNYFIFEENNI